MLRACLADFVADLKACLAGFVASSRAGLGLLVWAIFMGIIYMPQLDLRVKGIGNNMLDIFCLMNVDICMVIY